MAVKVIRIYELDGIVNARLELAGGFFEVEVPAGPVAGGYINKRLSFEQFAALLSSSYAALSLPAAQGFAAAGDVSPGTLYGITGDWNATGTDATVFVHGVRTDAFHTLGVVYDAQGKGQLVEVDVVAGAYVALGQLTPDQVAALQVAGANATNQFVLSDDRRLDPALLRLLPVGLFCYMYGPEDPDFPNTFGLDGTGNGHIGNTYGFGLLDCRFGDNHVNNTYLAGMQSISFGSNHADNTYGGSIVGCYFYDDQRGNRYGDNLTNSSIGAGNKYNVIGNDCSYITTNTNVTECEVGANCYGITFGANCKNVKVFDTRQGSGAGSTGTQPLRIPAGTQNAVYRRGVLVPAGGGSYTDAQARAAQLNRVAPAGATTVAFQAESPTDYVFYSGTFTVDVTSAVVGVVVFVELGAAATEPTLDPAKFELAGGSYASGKRNEYGFRVAASGKIHYVINQLP